MMAAGSSGHCVEWSLNTHPSELTQQRGRRLPSFGDLRGEDPTSKGALGTPSGTTAACAPFASEALVSSTPGESGRREWAHDASPRGAWTLGFGLQARGLRVPVPKGLPAFLGVRRPARPPPPLRPGGRTSEPVSFSDALRSASAIEAGSVSCPSGCARIGSRSHL
jgi:hypothetical protein